MVNLHTFTPKTQGKPLSCYVKRLLKCAHCTFQ